MAEGSGELVDRAVRSVVIEAPAGESPDFAPFDALLRQHDDGTITVTGAGGNWLPYLQVGDRLLLVREEDEGESHVQALRVTDALPDRDDTVVVVPDGQGRRSGRRAERTAVEGQVEVAWGDGDGEDRHADLVDVSLTGLHLVVHGGGPASGDAVRVAGTTMQPDGPPIGWQLSGQVAWVVQMGDQSAFGVVCDPGQRRPIVRLVRWARVRQLKAQVTVP